MASRVRKSGKMTTLFKPCKHEAISLILVNRLEMFLLGCDVYKHPYLMMIDNEIIIIMECLSSSSWLCCRLTSLILKVFAKGQELTGRVDQNVLNGAVSFLYTRQLTSGKDKGKFTEHSEGLTRYHLEMVVCIQSKQHWLHECVFRFPDLKSTEFLGS